MKSAAEIEDAFIRKLISKSFEYNPCLKTFVEMTTFGVSEDSEDMNTAVISRDSFTRGIQHYFPNLWDKIRFYLDKHFFIFEWDGESLKPAPVIMFFLDEYLKKDREGVSLRRFIRQGFLAYLESCMEVMGV